jgi:hypothetical protein
MYAFAENPSTIRNHHHLTHTQLKRETHDLLGTTHMQTLLESFGIEINHGVVIRELAARIQFAGRIPSKRRRLLELVEHLHNPGIPATMEQLRDASHYIKVMSQTIHRIQSASRTES